MQLEAPSIREDLLELGTILAAGLQRLSLRKSSQKSPPEAETSLDCGTLSEGHVHRKCEDMDP